MQEEISALASGVSRRSFLKWGAALGAASATTGLLCHTNDKFKTSLAIAEEEGGKWLNASCWFDCGGNCVNQAYVKDGAVLYQRTDTASEDSFDTPQQRGCHRGRSMRKLVFGSDRLKYPIKRKNWEPGGGNRALRGCDEWERISWDEALDLTTAEIKRIIADYGNTAILSAERSGPGRFFNAIGGSTTMWSCWSSGGFYWTSQKMIGGGWPRHALTLSDRYEYLDSKLIILWGHNPVWSSQGNPILTFLEAKRRGARIIVVDPIYHDSAKVLADEFIPVRPCTDTALLLGLAYEMIVNNLQDQEFLDTYCVGFDADHMPQGANQKENFKDYVLGTYDNTPKTPEWASALCGTPVATIKSLAREMATTKPMALTCSRAPSRIARGDQFAQAFLTIGWMTGNVGKRGAMVGHVVTSNVGSGSGGTWLINGGATKVPPIKNPISPYEYYTIDPADDSNWSCINLSEIWDAVLNKEYHAGVRGVIPINIQLINHIGRGSCLNQAPATARGIEAHRAVEFVVASGYHMNTNCRYADIVFPAATRWEEEGDTLLYTKTNRETMLSAQQITEPLFEAKTDSQIEEELAARMGVDRKKINPLSLKQIGFNRIAGTTMILEDGKTKAPLFTIEEDDIPEGVEGKPQEGRIPYKQFVSEGLCRVPRSEKDKLGYTALKDFIDDPVANPRPTPSGKLEIYCQGIVDFVNAVGYSEKSPIAQYDPPEEGYETTLSTQSGAEYPFQLVTLHCLRTVHSSFDNVPWTREAFPNDFQMNVDDATTLGIKSGDTVKISSHWGACLRNVDASTRIMPGVVKLDEASWVDVDESNGIDNAGSANYLVGPLKTGSGIQAWNSCNVKVEKWDGTPLPPDCNWPQRIVEG